MDLALNNDFDLDLTRGRARLVQGREELAQQLRLLFGIHAGEWFFDPSAGVDWRGLILVKAPNLALVRAELVRVIESASLVEELINYSQTFNSGTRSLHVEFRVQARVSVNSSTQTQDVSFALNVDPQASDGGVVALLEMLEVL